MKQTVLFLSLLLTACPVIEASAQSSSAIPDVQSDYETLQAPVIKVYSVKQGDFKFTAYVVNWKDAEVIVSDPLAGSDFKAGDTIQFMAQRVHLKKSGVDVSSLNFTLLNHKSTDAKTGASKHLRGVAALKAATNQRDRFYALGAAAKEAFANGNFADAKGYADELVVLTPQYKGDWNYGNAIQDANLVLGRLSVREGKINAAKKYLKESEKSPGSPQMNSFGPNVSLAKDLLEKGEKKAVLEYFAACKKFWSMGQDKLADWTALTKAGRIPDFGPNLIF